MGGKVSPGYVRALEVLDDREWHDVGDLIDAVAAAVPPGRAWRRAERQRLSDGGPPARVRGGQERAIRVGARSVAWDVVRSLVRFGTAERVGDRVRLR